MNQNAQNEAGRAKFTFASQGTAHDVEQGLAFQPKFDRDGLLAAIVTDAVTGQVLMFAWMNDVALSRTIETRTAHFWSRSRKKLWQKGEESGNLLDVVTIMTDCDQDTLLLSVRVRGAGVACHTGAESCFYREVVTDAGTGNPVLRRRV